MKIGSFEYNHAEDTYIGNIATLNFSFERVMLTPNDRKTDRQPDYRVEALTAPGKIELGAGWKRVSDKGNEYVSLSLDGPLLSAPLDARIFVESDGVTAMLVWNRQKAKPVTEAKEGPPRKLAKRAA